MHHRFLNILLTFTLSLATLAPAHAGLMNQTVTVDFQGNELVTYFTAFDPAKGVLRSIDLSYKLLMTGTMSPSEECKLQAPRPGRIAECYGDLTGEIRHTTDLSYIWTAAFSGPALDVIGGAQNYSMAREAVVKNVYLIQRSPGVLQHSFLTFVSCYDDANVGGKCLADLVQTRIKVELTLTYNFDEPVAVVSTPTTLAFFALGLFGMALRRFKTHS